VPSAASSENPEVDKDPEAYLRAKLGNKIETVRKDDKGLLWVYIPHELTNDDIRILGQSKRWIYGLAFKQMADNNLKQLADQEFPNLTGLYLVDSQITDIGLSEIARISNLEELILESNRVTMNGLKSLFSLKNLNLLELRSGIDDAGIQVLKDMSKLKNVYLADIKEKYE
jgi:hypothetical protein